MRRLLLDFQPPRRRLLSGLPLLLGGSLLLAAVVAQQSLDSRTEALQQRLQHSEQQLGLRPRSQPSLTSAQRREQAENLAQMRSLSQQLQRPWERLFGMLEALPQDDVALLSLTPDARKGQVRISAEARDLEAMLAFHQRLEASAELHDVSLLNHEIQLKQAEHPVQFNLSASWENGDAHL
ncbi:pilus assembly protein [Pseudomonas sp. SDI]|uniref:PilN domain-containing protein n=1 Tax=Pseudomonas sp. SDI TaxID=2170734 RepID=UPI000DE744B2|nr:PilN domain-containing protein [Pseudomonas sp. SDI]PWB33913.1 pilus assembly protein [Pseudomonas sp. SDI]